MQWSGWIYFGITVLLFITLVMIVLHYYRPKKKEDAEKAEKPKYTMLNDEDEIKK
ncbi:MAG: cbb3-type cytochrome c oxidase subunit 3 [Nitrospirae bacterium]|jgi:cbb3-type cytochrome oxidase subunit 3|nr:cbb3-type cytochrome c oxidase subunit 3 [Nitrospirota bacterium]